MEFYPSLNELISSDQLPDFLSDLDGGLGNLIGNIKLKEYQVDRSAHIGGSSWYLVLRTYQRVDLNLFGTGLKLIFNPSFDAVIPGSFTDIPLSLAIRFPIANYIGGFSLDQFSDSPDAFFDLVNRVLQTDEDVLTESVIVNVIPSKLGQDFVTEINNFYSLSPSLNPTLTGNPQTDAIEINAAIDSHPTFSAQDKDIFDVLREIYILASSPPIGQIDFIEGAYRPYFQYGVISALKTLLIPEIDASIQISAGLEFPREYLQPIDTNGNLETNPLVKTVLFFSAGEFRYSTKGLIGFSSPLTISFPSQYPKAQIGNTGLKIGFQNAKLDLSREKNIPEAVADRRPDDFIGVFIQSATIDLPPKWFKEPPVTTPPAPVSTASIIGENLLIGTGGISGKITLDTAGYVYKNIGKFGFYLDQCDITFQQNAVVESNIFGRIKINGFQDAAGGDAIIDVKVHIAENGDFSVVAKENNGIAIKIPDVLQLTIKTLSFGREDDRMYVETSGTIKILNAAFERIFKGEIDIEKFRIWDDGSIELVGGELHLKDSIPFQLGPAAITITALHVGSYEGYHNGELRKYRFLGFDGGVKIAPGGVEASGKGIKFYFTVDNATLGDLHVFVKLQSLTVDIVLPHGATGKDITTAIHGFLSMNDSADSSEAQEYIGGVEFMFRLAPDKYIAGSAAMRYNPEKPSFIVDASIALPTPIPVTPGLGIYGFRGLVGTRYVADREYVAAQNPTPAVTDLTDWYQYYKAQVAPTNTEGINVGKFAPKDGFSLGAGVSLATTGDSGKAFSSKLFFLLSLPHTFLLQGQAAILRQRIDLAPTTDEPPFSALIGVDPSGVRGGLGFNYQIPEDSGKIIAMHGKIDLNFPFHGPGWYINAGKDQPVSERIQARMLTLFDVNAYLMISAAGIRVGAGAYWDFNLDISVLKIHAYLQAEAAARLSFKRLQIGGSLAVAGGVDVTVFGFNFGSSLSMGLGAEAPKPFKVHGEASICVKVLKKEHCASLSFSWIFEQNNDLTPVADQVLNTETDPASGAPQGIKGKNQLTGETFYVGLITGGPTGVHFTDPTTDAASIENFIVPLDATIDMEFKKAIAPGTFVTNIGGNTQGLFNTELIPPQHGLSNQVSHTYTVESVDIYYKDASGWLPYDIYEALVHPADASIIQTTNFSDLKIGYWQYEEPNKLNKLSILATNPFTYLASGALSLEDTGLSTDDIFCGDEPIEENCFTFDMPWFNFRDEITELEYERLYSWNGLSVRITHSPQSSVPVRLLNIPNVFNITKALELHSGDMLELFFDQPMATVTLRLGTMASSVRVLYYKKLQTGTTSGGIPVYGYRLISDRYEQGIALMLPVVYDNRELPVDKVEIIPQECKEDGGSTLDEYEEQQCEAVELLIEKLKREIDKLQREYNSYEQRCKAEPCAEETSYWCHLAGEIQNQINELQSELNELQAFLTEYCDCVLLQENTGELDQENTAELLLDTTGAIVATDSDSTGDELTLECSTFFFGICRLSVVDYDYNASIPSFADLANEQASMHKGMQQVIQPIWRPYTHYAIHMTVSDKVNSNSPTTQDYTMYFRTVGPIGHFHSYIDDVTPYENEVDTAPTNLAGYYDPYDASANPDGDRYAEDRRKLTGLKHYIDYGKSYPNADGALLNSKPLFYQGAKLLLFFLKPYVYTMFGDFADLADPTVTRMTSSLSLDIIDPVDPALDEDENIIGPVASASLSFHSNSNPHIEPAVELYNNLTAAEDNCVGAEEVSPIGINAESILSDLKPLKLYTAVYKSNFKRFNDDGTPFDVNTRSVEVHRHVFKTSRYSNFEEQVNSYILAEDEDGNITAKAIFDYSADFHLYTSLAGLVLNNTLPSNDSLFRDYALDYDRLVTGALRMNALDAPETTEFNFIKDTGNNDRTIGILVRNPEPFNDPKIPVTELVTTLTVSLNGGPTSYFRIIFSKDTSCAFISNPSMNLVPGVYTFTFKYLTYNGAAYVVQDTRTVVIDTTVPSTTSQSQN